MTKMLKSEEGFTGLEAAIVLIAFVVVAAVFSYVVLGAGFFTTQKSQQVVYSSVDMASSSLEVLGDVYGMGEDNEITGLQFVVGLTSGGASVDLSNTNLLFKNSSVIVDLARDANITAASTDVVVPESAATEATTDTWFIIDIANGDDGALLENQEQVTIYAKLGTGDLSVLPNEDFSLEIKPPTGASYAIQRSAPAKIATVNILN